MRKSLPIILAGCILLFGCALLLYPSFSQWLSSGKQSQVVADYESAVDDWGDEVARRELERARKYNEDLTEAVALSDPFAEQDAEASTDYDTLLNFTAEGVMGYVEIPKIEVLLPIYHGVSSDILAKGASLGEAIAAMDVFCTAYLAENGGSVDYIHGDDEAIALAAGDGCCGILMPRMDKAELFTSVLRSGPFPKKSFSIGLGADKRYYLECRKL